MKRSCRNGSPERLAARLLTLVLRRVGTATVDVGDSLGLAELLPEVLEQVGREGVGTLPDRDHVLKLGLLIGGDDLGNIVHQSGHELCDALYGGWVRAGFSSAFDLEVLPGVLREIDPLANDTVYNIQRTKFVSRRRLLKRAVHALSDMLLGLDIGRAEFGDGVDLIPTSARWLQLIEGCQHGLQITERWRSHDREAFSLRMSGSLLYVTATAPGIGKSTLRW